MYGLGQSPAKTTYRLWPTRNPACIVISLCILKKHENPTHIRLEIIYICINKPFRVQFYPIGTFHSYFVYLTKNENTKENVIFWISKYMNITYIFTGSSDRELCLYQPRSIVMLRCNIAMQYCDAIDRNRISHIPPGRL